MSDCENEVMLSGGNVSSVYRVGDTVRREVKPNSARIHKLLKHLENKGWLCKTIIRNANEGEVAFQKMIAEGHLEHYQKDIKFIRNYGK